MVCVSVPKSKNQMKMAKENEGGKKGRGRGGYLQIVRRAKRDARAIVVRQIPRHPHPQTLTPTPPFPSLCRAVCPPAVAA